MEGGEGSSKQARRLKLRPRAVGGRREKGVQLSDRMCGIGQ